MVHEALVLNYNSGSSWSEWSSLGQSNDHHRTESTELYSSGRTVVEFAKRRCKGMMYKTQDPPMAGIGGNGDDGPDWEILWSAPLDRLRQSDDILLEDADYILHKCLKNRNCTVILHFCVYIYEKGFETISSFGNHLVQTLVDIGCISDAQILFGRLPETTECSWNSIIIGHLRCGNTQHALLLYTKMLDDTQHQPDRFTFAALLKACAELKDIERGSKIHAHVARCGLVGHDPLVGSTLISMYAKCGFISRAEEEFNKILVHDVVSWTALIAAYVQHGYFEEALEYFYHMQLQSICPDAATFVCVLKACAHMGAIQKGQEIHSMVFKRGLGGDIFVGSTLVDMYVKCGLFAKAQEVFDKLSSRNLVSWNILISGYARYDCGDEALNHFDRMRSEGIAPNAITYASIFRACSCLGALKRGEELHAEVLKKGLEKEPFVGNALVDMYAKCGVLAKAQETFDNLPCRDVVTWTALIAGYTQHANNKKALDCYIQMQMEGISPNAFTYVCALKACTNSGYTDKGQEIHDELRKGPLERGLVVGTALVDMYGKAGLVDKAQEAFDKISQRDVVAWSTLIGAYAQHGHGGQALKYFDQMKQEGLSPNAVTYVFILQACSSIGAIDRGVEIHLDIANEGSLERDLLVGTSLVDMYAKFGSLSKAYEVFDKLLVRNVASWSALITGYAQIGEIDSVFFFFDRIITEGLKPDGAAFAIVLNACCHAGLVGRAQMYLDIMCTDYSITPLIEHHSCMIDLLGRVGQFGKVLDTIKCMPHSTDLVLWHTVLAGCRKWNNVELAREAFEHAVRLEESAHAAYVSMHNIYLDAGIVECVDEIEAVVVQNLGIFVDPC